MKSEIKVHDSFSSVIRSLNQFFTTVPGIVERRKAESGVLAEAEKPTSRPQIQISYESGITLIDGAYSQRHADFVNRSILSCIRTNDQMSCMHKLL